jgi:hypothetical protein
LDRPLASRMLARLRPYILLFVGLSIVYHANLRPVDSGDSLPASLLPLAILLDHTVTLDRFVPWLRAHVWYTNSVVDQAHGHFFSHFPIGGPLLATPLYLPVALFAPSHWDVASLVTLARILAKFAATTIAAMSAVLLLILLKRITTERWAWWLAIVYALGTETWSISSQALWQEGPGELAIIACFYCLERWTVDRATAGWLWLCGASAAMALIVRPTNSALALALVVALIAAKGNRKEHLRLWIPLAVGGLLVASYNLYVFQRPSGGYAMAILSGSTLTGVAGLLLSPGRGLLIYTPVAVFALCAFFPSAAVARVRHKPLLMTAALFIILELLTMAASIRWWGGYTWGPRLLTEIAPALIVLMAAGVAVMDRPWPRRAFATLAVYSVLIQAEGAFFYPKGHWDAGPPSVDDAPGRLWEWRDNPIGRTLRGGPFWEPYAIVGAAFTEGIPAARRRMREVNVNPYEQAQPAGVR